MILILTIINSLAFISYGLLCITTDHMINEFTRYKLLHFRRLTGILEILGGFGCIIGFYYIDFIYALSTLGLAILMTMGTIVRVRIKDPLLETIPAIALGLINYYLLYHLLIK